MFLSLQVYQLISKVIDFTVGVPTLSAALLLAAHFGGYHLSQLASCGIGELVVLLTTGKIKGRRLQALSLCLILASAVVALWGQLLPSFFDEKAIKVDEVKTKATFREQVNRIGQAAVVDNNGNTRVELRAHLDTLGSVYKLPERSPPKLNWMPIMTTETKRCGHTFEASGMSLGFTTTKNCGGPKQQAPFNKAYFDTEDIIKMGTFRPAFGASSMATPIFYLEKSGIYCNMEERFLDQPEPSVIGDNTTTRVRSSYSLIRITSTHVMLIKVDATRLTFWGDHEADDPVAMSEEVGLSPSDLKTYYPNLWQMKNRTLASRRGGIILKHWTESSSLEALRCQYNSHLDYDSEANTAYSCSRVSVRAWIAESAGDANTTLATAGLYTREEFDGVKSGCAKSMAPGTIANSLKGVYIDDIVTNRQRANGSLCRDGQSDEVGDLMAAYLATKDISVMVGMGSPAIYLGLREVIALIIICIWALATWLLVRRYVAAVYREHFIAFIASHSMSGNDKYSGERHNFTEVMLAVNEQGGRIEALVAGKPLRALPHECVGYQRPTRCNTKYGTGLGTSEDSIPEK